MSAAACAIRLPCFEDRQRAEEDSTSKRSATCSGLFTRSAADWLEDWFESDPVKAAFGFDAVVGNYASPYHPGTAYVLLHHCFGEVNGKRGLWGHAIGGMGAISEALAAEARRLGVEIECDAPVARVQPGSVVLADGREVAGARHRRQRQSEAAVPEAGGSPRLLERDFRERMERYKCGSATFRMNVALVGAAALLLPARGRAAPRLRHHHGAVARLHGPRLPGCARRAASPRAPIVEMVIPSTLDDTLAPKGAHVASLFCQHFAPDADWGGAQAGGDRADLRRGRSRMRRDSGRASSRTARCRRPTWSASSASPAATSSTASCRSTSSGRRGRCWAMPTTARR